MNNSFLYNFEIEDILAQFIATIDGAIVYRYEKNENNERELDLSTKIIPNYNFGPKQRVFSDIINPAKNYTLPLVNIQINSISRDKDRISGKLNPIEYLENYKLTSYKRPLPITISVTVTIMTKYVTDLYQIFSNLTTMFINYVEYSWKVPSATGTIEELRSRIEWDGNIKMEYPIKLEENKEDRFTSSLEFKIDGFIFNGKKDHSPNMITSIGDDVREKFKKIINSQPLMRPLVRSVVKDGKKYLKYDNPREFSNLHPQITNIYSNRSDKLKIIDTLDGMGSDDISLTIKGYSFDNVKILYKPAIYDDRFGDMVTMEYERFIFPEKGTLTDKKGIIEGYEIPFVIIDDNTLKIDLKNLNIVNQFDVYILNDVDYDSFSNFFTKS